MWLEGAFDSAWRALIRVTRDRPARAVACVSLESATTVETKRERVMLAGSTGLVPRAARAARA